MLHRLALLFVILSMVHSHSLLRNEYIRFKSQSSVINSPVEQPKTRRVVPIKAGEKSPAMNPDLFFPPLPGQSNNDFHPQLRREPTENETLYYYSWHIHTYFFHENVNVTKRALALRQEFMKYFNIEKCIGDCFMGAIFDNCTRMCVWDPVMGVDGPHPYGQWGVYLPNESLIDTLAWMSENHGEFEVLFHPNTGLMVGDHDSARRAMWIKQTVPLDLDFLRWLQCKWFGCSDGFKTQ
jgi:aromatic ring-cleaving dioxygenase